MINSAAANVSKGNFLYRLGKYKESIVLFNKAIELDPESYVAYFEKANSLYDLEDYKEAIESYDKAIEFYPNPNNHDAYIKKGDALYALGKFEEAIESYDKAIEFDPNNHVANNNKTNALKALGKFEESIKYYNKTIEFDPSNPDAYNNKGNSLYALEKFEEAIDSYDKAIELEPNNPVTYNNKGNALNDLGKFEEAIKYYNKAIEFDPSNPDAYNNKGNALYALKLFEEAIESHDKVIEIYPQYSVAYNNKGNDLYFLGKLEEAIEYYNKAIEFDHKNHFAYNNKANALNDLGKFEEAIESYDKAIEFYPNNPDAYNNKVNAIEQLLRKEILEINPEEPEYSIHFEEINLITLLGVGGVGRVFLGEYNSKYFAVEEIICFHNKREIENIIASEINQFKNLKHHNLIRYYGYSLKKVRIRIVMELCTGGNLYNLLYNKNTTLSLKQKLQILFDTAVGLNYLHSQNPPILHLDIKPQNICIKEVVKDENTNVTAKISDFGLAMKVSYVLNYGNFMSQFEVPEWMPPEIYRGEEFGVKSDVFLFAFLMWEVFAQKIPFVNTYLELQKIPNLVANYNLRPSVKLLPRETPKDIFKLMKLCWDEDVDQRPTMKEVAEIIQTLIQ